VKTKGIDLNIQNTQSKGLSLKDSNKVIQDDSRFIPEPYKKVASGMEQEFARFMVEQMEKTVTRENPDSQATAYYKSIVNQERAEAMSETGKGLGLKQMILDQIYPKHLRNQLALDNFNAQMNAQNLRQQKIKMYQSQDTGASSIPMAPKSEQGE
jgi:Rod binding domain-containing protein